MSAREGKLLIVMAGRDLKTAALGFMRNLMKHNIPFRAVSASEGLSVRGPEIAVLPPNGVKALRHMGLGSEIDSVGHQIKEVFCTGIAPVGKGAGELFSRTFLTLPGLNKDKFFALPGARFQNMLAQGLTERIQFKTQVSSIQQKSDQVVVRLNTPRGPVIESYSAVIAADGVHSPVRQGVFGAGSAVDLGVTTLQWVVKDPLTSNPLYMLDQQGIFVAFPMGDGEVYCYAHLVDPTKRYLSEKGDFLKRIWHFGGAARQMVDALGLSIYDKGVFGRSYSLRSPFFHLGRVGCLGDASHGCSPFLHQGHASALEDGIVLAELLKVFSVQQAFNCYKRIRAERVMQVMLNSDGPLKNLINTTPDGFQSLIQEIRENGPPNIQGLRELLKADPLNHMRVFIEREKQRAEETSLHCSL